MAMAFVSGGGHYLAWLKGTAARVRWAQAR